MATYFHGNAEMQGNGDALQTLFLMNPTAYVGYSDNQHQLPPPPSATNFIYHGGGSIPGFHYNLYNPVINGGEAREVTRAKQGLSLSLSPQQPPPPPQGEVRVSGGVSESVVLSCKYLKVAQQLLHEVVSIGKEVKNGRDLSKEENGQPKNSAESAAAEEAVDGGAKRGAELTAAEKQEIQMKKVKLVDMLNEVEQRYKQYEQKMQMVIRWFEEAAGAGSAKTYTALALQAISKQFRCLKDAITAQTKRLGQDESSSLGGKMEGGSRLKYIDNEMRQQRALRQQFGMIQNNAWRPQRGLPERSVSVLRAWLFEHFLHPYPKDTDKIMLAKQAGLTRSQVSNWFINARVRLWKPMVEEMYAEEMKAQRQNGSSEEDETPKSEDKQVSNSQEIHNYKNTSSSTTVNNNNNVGLFNLIGSSETESITQRRRMMSPKKPRNADVLQPPPMIIQQEPSDEISMKYGYERESREGFTITGAPANFFGTYAMMGMEQFQPPYSSNGVSLTLGLHHCENISNQNVNRGGEPEQDVNNDFGSLNYDDNIQVQNSKRFAAQLMPDFVT